MREKRESKRSPSPKETLQEGEGVVIGKHGQDRELLCFPHASVESKIVRTYLYAPMEYVGKYAEFEINGVSYSVKFERGK